MTKIEIIQLGKDKETWISDAVTHYTTLLKRFTQIETITIKNVKHAKNLSINELRSKEAELYKPYLNDRKYIALSDKGKKYNSISFSKFISTIEQQLNSKICFVIGGAYGLDDGILDKADSVLSLSELTMSHQLVRLVLLEQLYRAYSILHNTDYHK